MWLFHEQNGNKVRIHTLFSVKSREWGISVVNGRDARIFNGYFGASGAQ
jgi:hypothetical protein